MHKPGWQTSEFWTTMLLVVGVVAFSLSDSLPERWGAVAASVSVAAYSISRGLTKLFSSESPKGV